LNQIRKLIARMALKPCAIIVIAAGFLIAIEAISLAQQRIGIPVQLPVVNRFSVNTVVSVPDGGTLSLGGISRSTEGSTFQRGRRASGLLSRPFPNRGRGTSTSSSNASVTVHILSSREMSEDVLAAARAARPANYEEIQARERKADFLTRNIGRNRRR